jgi:deferrochelatase/peroxidase EfeB
MMSLEQSDVDAIRNAGTLLDGGHATCDAESLSTTLQDVYSSIATAHPEHEVKAILVQLEANGTEHVHTAVQAFLDTLGDIDALWSIDSKLPIENVNVFMLVSMGKK